MGKLKFTLSNILFWPSLMASCLLLENVGFLSSDPKGGLSDTHFFMLFALAMIGYLAYFIFDHIRNRSSIDFFLIAIFGIAFGVGLIAIWNFTGVDFKSDKPGYDFSYFVDTWDKAKQTLSLLTFVVTLYAFMFFMNKNYPSVRKLKVVFIGILVVAYISIIYSLIAEWWIYEYNLAYMPAHPINAQSIFWNANMFSSMLLMGVASSIGLNIYKKNAFSYISIVILTIMIVLVGSLAAIIVVTATTLIYFLLEIIFLFHQRSKASFFCLIIYLLIIALFFILYACGLKYDMGIFSHMCTYLHRGLRAADYHTLHTRTFTWTSCIDYIGQNPLNLLFGFGFRNANYIIGGFWTSRLHIMTPQLSAHSGYIQILMDFGIVGVVIYAAFLVYFFYCFLRLLKYHTRFALLFFVIGACFVAYGVMESILFFIPNSQGLLIGFTFFMPMINKWKHVKHSNLGDDVLEVNRPVVMDANLLTKSIARIIMSLIAVAISLFIFPISLEDSNLQYLLINIIVILGLCLFTLPFIISSQSIRHSRGAFLANMIINLVLIFGSAGSLLYLQFNGTSSGIKDAKWVVPVLLFIVLVGEVIILSIAKRRKFKDYLVTFIGASKNSFMGLIGVGVLVLITYFVSDRMEMYAPMTLIIYPFLGLYFYYIFSCFVPFWDYKEIINHYNSLAIYSLKKEVLKDRLGYFNERRKD